MKRLHPLLRLAVVSGVETAVELHIRRGDEIDARDGSGATPLILAASRSKAAVVRLLLEAGANPTLVDPDGMDAMAHAKASGCPETITMLTAALVRASISEHIASDVTPLSIFEPTVEIEPPAEMPRVDECANEASSSEVLSLDDVPLDTSFDDAWEAEEEPVAPEEDASVIQGAIRLQATISEHEPVDRDEEWSDVDLLLPERATPLAREDGDGAIRSLLLAALREGMVSEGDLAEVCSNIDGTRDEAAEKLLAIVAGELGATVVEWTGMEGAFHGEQSIEEERLLSEATEFAEDLASGHNDPFRIYSRDIRGKLLEAREEIALGREMEEAGRDAMAALARWPEGLAMLFDAADRVARAEAGADSFSSGPEPLSDDKPIAPAELPDQEEEGEGLDEEALSFVSAVTAIREARGNVQHVAEALNEIRLTRRFLFDLAEQAERNTPGADFAEALKRQSTARERMILSNLRLALSVAKKYRWSGLPFDDLVQEANIGLMKAVERYDWRRGFRFSTYATWWIRQRVTRSIADAAKVVRAPVHVQETARKVIRDREAVERQLGRLESEIETARRINSSLSRTWLLLSMFDDADSLDEIDPETGLPKVDLLLAPEATDPAAAAERAFLRSTLLGMLDEIDKRSRDVLVLRFGLGGEDAMTLEEVGQHFGVTRERIRQIESKAMRKLSHQNRRSILQPFMGDDYCPQERSSTAAMEAVVSLSDEFPERSSSGETVDPAISLPLPAHARPAAEKPKPIRSTELAAAPPPVDASSTCTTVAPKVVS